MFMNRHPLEFEFDVSPARRNKRSHRVLKYSHSAKPAAACAAVALGPKK